MGQGEASESAFSRRRCNFRTPYHMPTISDGVLTKSQAPNWNPAKSPYIDPRKLANPAVPWYGPTTASPTVNTSTGNKPNPHSRCETTATTRERKETSVFVAKNRPRHRFVGGILAWNGARTKAAAGGQRGSNSTRSVSYNAESFFGGGNCIAGQRFRVRRAGKSGLGESRMAGSRSSRA